MPKFQYSALASTGQKLHGELLASDRLAAIRQLQLKQLTPIRLTSQQSQDLQRRRVSLADMCQFCSGMADLLESGIPLLKAMEFSIQSQSRNRAFQSTLQQVHHALADGATLGEALEDHGAQFDTLTISILAVGEEGGFLEESFQRAAEIIQRREELKNRLLAAMTYPAFLMVIGLVVAIGMFLFFVPVFEPLFDRMRERNELPWITSAFLAFSHALKAYLLPIVGGVLATAAILWAWLSSEKGSLKFSQVCVNLPGVGPVLRDVVIARFCHVMGSLLGNGIPLLRSLAMAQQAAGSKFLTWELRESERSIASGKSLAESLGKSQIFAGEIAETIAIAEQANQLEPTLAKLSGRLDRRAQMRLDQFSKLLEPILMTFLASLIGLLIVALLMPIFTTSGRFH